jgi:subtilisin family serine protease
VIGNRPAITRRSKIAILDSGIDWRHPCFQEAISEGRLAHRSFVPGLSGDMDTDGHGTHTAHLAAKVAPNAKLFIARVYEHGNEDEFDANVSAVTNVSVLRPMGTHKNLRLTFPHQAIRWAVEQGVDIISMSFGYRREIPSIKAAIRDAFHKGIIILAAASNSGVNPRFPVSFPANIRQVICIHSSDGNGNPSGRNPPPMPDCNLSILGEGVAAAWPGHLYTERDDHLRVASGSSVATPIAAGLAALIIEYASQAGEAPEVVPEWMRLRHSDEMRKMFKSIARERAGYHSIAPSSLFDYHGEEMHQRICGRISDVLGSL